MGKSKKLNSDEKVLRPDSPSSSADISLVSHQETSAEFWNEEHIEEFLKKLHRIADEKPNATLKSVELGDIKIDGVQGKELKNAWRKLRADCLKKSTLKFEIDIIERHYKKLLSRPTSKPKQPDGLPKRPLTAYFLFAQKERLKLKKKHPTMANPIAVATYLSNKWKELDENKRQKYFAKFKEETDKYNDIKNQFYNEHPDQRPAPSKKESKSKKPNNKRSTNPVQLKSALDLFTDANRKTYAALGYKGNKLKDKLVEKFMQLSADKRRELDLLAEQQLERYLKYKKEHDKDEDQENDDETEASTSKNKKNAKQSKTETKTGTNK